MWVKTAWLAEVTSNEHNVYDWSCSDAVGKPACVFSFYFEDLFL